MSEILSAIIRLLAERKVVAVYCDCCEITKVFSPEAVPEEWECQSCGQYLGDANPLFAVPSPEEKPMKGLKEIADYMGWSLDKLKHKSKELQREGVLTRTLKGKPPHRRVEIIAYRSTVKAYIEEESPKKESKQKK